MSYEREFAAIARPTKEIEALRSQMEGLDEEGLRRLCETIYGLYLQAKAERSPELPVAREVKLRAIVPEYDGMQLYDLDETELRVLELVAFCKLTKKKSVDRRSLEAMVGGFLEYTLQELRRKGAIWVSPQGKIMLSPSIRFEVAY